MSDSRLTIIVSGMIAADPHQGGATWAVLQYVLGLRDLGHRVFLIEPIDENQILPAGSSLSESLNARYFQQVLADFDLRDCGALLDVKSKSTFGLPYAQLRNVADQADLLINISGMLTDPRFFETIPVRVYLDLDPAFIQIWQTQGIDMRLTGHTHFVTIGQSIGQPGCPVPTCGVRWIPTLQPIFLPEWPKADRISRDALTTIGNWRGYGSVEYEGKFYGQKAHSLRGFLELPQRTSEKLLLAMSIHPGEVNDLSALSSHRWELVDPREVAGTPASYRRFIQESKGEFGIAKSGYVASRCGWFSDRSVCYLASGRPVIAQETGFSRYLPIGEGLHAFETIDDIVNGIDSLNRDFSRHSTAARDIAVEYFDSRKVLNRLLDKVGSRMIDGANSATERISLRRCENPIQVHSEELQRILSEQLRARGISKPISRVERQSSICRSSYPLEDLTVHFEDQTCLELVFKDVNPVSLSSDARRAKPEFLDNALREIELYRSLLDASQHGTATYYGSVIDESSGRFWLFLEKVSGHELYQFGKLEVWKEAARWLAHFHTESSVRTTRSANLIHFDAAYYENWMRRASDFCAQRSDSDQPRDFERLQSLKSLHPLVVEKLTALPVTLIHGEFYASNILVRDQAARPGICPIDWERAAIGPGLIDLAALTAGKWSDEDRTELAMAYCDALPSAGNPFASLDSFFESLNVCRLHLALQWLGWSPDWSPPAEHRQDWLAEAETAASALQCCSSSPSS